MRIYLDHGLLEKDFVIDNLESEFKYLKDNYDKWVFVIEDEVKFMHFKSKKQKNEYLERYKNFTKTAREYGDLVDEVIDSLISSKVRNQDSVKFYSDGEMVIHDDEVADYVFEGGSYDDLFEISPILLTDEEYNSLFTEDFLSQNFKYHICSYYNKRRSLTSDDLVKILKLDDEFISAAVCYFHRQFFIMPDASEISVRDAIYLELRDNVRTPALCREIIIDYLKFLDTDELSNLLIDILFKYFSSFENELDDENKEFYFKLIQKGEKSKVLRVIHYLAYGFYCGSPYIRQDFATSAKYLQILADAGDFNAYNSLGYIYYYGRLGKKDYKKAFECFSLASHGNVFEATYKLGDMYKNGYYVEKNLYIAEKLYSRNYKEALEEFLNDQGYEIADIALRLASLEKEGSREAINYYLLAKCASDARVKNSNFFGDKEVAKRINKEVSKLKNDDEEFSNNIVTLNDSLALNDKLFIYIDSEKNVMRITPCDNKYLIFFAKGKFYRKEEIEVHLEHPLYNETPLDFKFMASKLLLLPNIFYSESVVIEYENFSIKL